MTKPEAQKIFEGINIKSETALKIRYEKLRDELSALLDETENIQTRIQITNKIGELDDAFMLLSGKKPYEKKAPKKNPVFVILAAMFAVVGALNNLVGTDSPLQKITQPNLEEIQKRGDTFAKRWRERDSLAKADNNSEDTATLRQNDDDLEHN